MKATTEMRIWMFAVLLLACVPTAFGYGLGTFERQFDYTADQLSSIKYFVVKEPTERLLLNFSVSGDIAPYAHFRFNHYWYSGRLDKTDVRLERVFDLSNLTAATLKFYTKYNIESGYDFGYVQVSTNNGTSWSQLPGTTTNTNRAGDAYVGIPGAPAYNGAVSDWTLETVDLTPYVGNVINLRFWYVSDDWYSEHGWLIDDISIQEIGFMDDVESGSNGWVTDGWFSGVVEVTDNSSTVATYLDVTIPSNFTSNGSAGKILVSQVGGVDADYNPSQAAVSSIIVNLPPLVRYIPPTPPSGGGGGGGGGYSIRKDEAVQYIIDQIMANIDKIIDVNNPDTPVREIVLALNSFVKDVEIRVTPLSFKPYSIKQDLPDVYKYFDISTTGIYSSLLSKVVIKVAVPKEWVKAKGVGPEDMVVTRYSNGAWSDLNTLFMGEDEGEYLYDSYSPGFSVFAVRVRSPITPPLVRPVPTVKPNITQLKPVTIVTGNESEAEFLEGVKETLRKKSQGTDEEMERMLGPSREKPYTWVPLLAKVAGIVIGLAALVGCIAILLYKMKANKVMQVKPAKIKGSRRGKHKR